MDELGFTKIAAAVLSTALGIMVIRMMPEIFMHKSYPEVPAYTVGPMESPETGDAEPLPFPQAEWVAAMDETRGAKVFKKCTSCHNVEAGGANGTGPNLYGVVGAKPGAKEGFSYSTAVLEMETDWTYEALDGYLTKPSKYLPGNKMSFVGIKKDADRAAVIEYLRVNAGTVLPRPEPAMVETNIVEVPSGNPAVIEEPAVDPTEQKVLSPEKIEELQ